MALTPQDVQQKEFRQQFRGYNEVEVDAFLDEVEVELARLIAENDDLRQRLAHAAQAPAQPAQPVSEGDEMLRRTLLLAQRTADETVAAARDEAERLLGESRAQAQHLLAEAQGQAQQQIGDLDQRRQQLEQHIEGLRAFEREYRTRLKAYLESQLRDLDGRGGQTAAPAPGAGPTFSPVPPPGAAPDAPAEGDSDVPRVAP